ncbi:hypothetical protein Tco_0652534 [Tanacetum coccineum]|uniref:Uncharacterized protein n=1 Tax=Tanacetum coccineum TaxID=301880 RepID=A0ABQ4WY15_9ASTR
MPCDICQKAKQTREPFLLSEHKSIVLAELVHLDLWGPYKVIKHSFVDQVSQDLDHVNFFDEIVHESPDTPNDDTNLNAQAQNDGSNSSQPSSLTIDLF